MILAQLNAPEWVSCRPAGEARRGGRAIPCNEEQQSQTACKARNRVRSGFTPSGRTLKGRNTQYLPAFRLPNKRSTEVSRMMAMLKMTRLDITHLQRTCSIFLRCGRRPRTLKASVATWHE